MTRNDTFFKILFAIEIALLPLVMAAYLLMPTWSVGLFVAGILITKIWLELFKNKEDKTHRIIIAIGNVLTVSTLVIFFAIQGYINVVLCVFVVLLALITNLVGYLMRESTLPDMIDAVDVCYMLFEMLLLVGLSFVTFSQLVTNIALTALILTSLVSVAYKLYYAIKYNNLLGKIKNLFFKLFGRK